MTTGDITLAPRPPSPWIVMSGQQAGQPTPAFYRFIINLLGQSNSTSDLVLILEALTNSRTTSASGGDAGSALTALALSAPPVTPSNNANDILMALALAAPNAEIAQIISQIAALAAAIAALQVVPTTFAGLPATPTDGQPGYITDCTSTTFAAAAAGGGANHVPVWYNLALTSWRIG